MFIDYTQRSAVLACSEPACCKQPVKALEKVMLFGRRQFYKGPASPPVERPPALDVAGLKANGPINHLIRDKWATTHG